MTEIVRLEKIDTVGEFAERVFVRERRNYGAENCGL